MTARVADSNPDLGRGFFVCRSLALSSYRAKLASVSPMMSIVAFAVHRSAPL